MAADSPLHVVILAAGQGTRMRSALPKVLHPIGGRPILSHIIDATGALRPAAVHLVVGHGAEQVKTAIGGAVNWVLQAEQLGTGHAVMQALPHIPEDATVLILLGDVPLITAEILERSVAAARAGALALVTADFDDPAQLGRIIRDDAGSIARIVEFKDATPQQRDIREINSGIMALGSEPLHRFLQALEPNNAQQEYYLTDIIAMSVAAGIPVEGVKAGDPWEVTGINDRVQLAQAERLFQRRQAEDLMRGGVTLADPARLDIRGRVRAGQDCFIDVDVILEGDVTLGAGVTIASGCVLRNSVLGDGVQVESHTLIDGAQIEANCTLGPFARIRPGTELAEGVRIGNFVETKKSRLGPGSKANHLAYLGDTVIGANCNVGAGTVTCNYDGISKHPTTIGNGVFVGTNSTLVAPLTIDDDAFIAAGSTVTSHVARGDLAVGRGRQRNISGWTRPDKRGDKAGNRD